MKGGRERVRNGLSTNDDGKKGKGGGLEGKNEYQAAQRLGHVKIFKKGRVKQKTGPMETRKTLGQVWTVPNHWEGGLKKRG